MEAVASEDVNCIHFSMVFGICSALTRQRSMVRKRTSKGRKVRICTSFDDSQDGLCGLDLEGATNGTKGRYAVAHEGGTEYHSSCSSPCSSARDAAATVFALVFDFARGASLSLPFAFSLASSSVR